MEEFLQKFIERINLNILDGIRQIIEEMLKDIDAGGLEEIHDEICWRNPLRLFWSIRGMLGRITRWWFGSIPKGLLGGTPWAIFERNPYKIMQTQTHTNISEKNC